MSKRNKWITYEACKRKWVEDHPDATPEQYQNYILSLCDYLKI